MIRKPLAIDLFCGLGGWSEGALAEGYEVVGFDNERHVYGDHHYPAQLVLQDVLTLHGSQFRNAALLVASPPCQAYSYMAMPWSRAKREVRWQQWARSSPFGDFRLNDLFNACFRIQREACEAAGHHVPMVVENVKGAQPWVGRAAWHYGSFYLWGDVPALMPPTLKAYKTEGRNPVTGEGVKQHGSDKALDERRKEANQMARKGLEGKSWIRNPECDPRPSHGNSPSRKAASAQIAKIPLELARWIAHVYRPDFATPSGPAVPGQCPAGVSTVLP